MLELRAKAKPALTIGFAHWGDYSALYQIIHELREYHNLAGVELLFVGNDPEGIATQRLLRRVGSFGHNIGGFRAIHFPDVPGPALAKDRVFREAYGDVVWLLDAHCGIKAGSVARVIEFFARHPNTTDLFCGPLIDDNRVQRSTHLNAVWGSHSWGQWALAWRAPTGEHVSPKIVGRGRNATLQFVTLVEQQPWQHELNGQPWLHHEGRLVAAGFTALGYDDDAEPFEIWAQGCFSMACRKEAWLGYNERMRGFGGEEGCFHLKWRHAGRRVMCLPCLAAEHRFADDDIDPPTHPRPARERIRNTILQLQDVGYPTSEAKAHFVATRAITPEAWDAIEANPDLHLHLDLAKPKLPEPVTIEQIYRRTLADRQGYFWQHMRTLRVLVNKFPVIEEVSRYPETTIALLAGQPKRLRSHVYGEHAQNPIYKRLQSLMGTLTKEVHWDLEQSHVGMMEFEVQPCDLLVYKTDHEYQHLERDLAKWARLVSKAIVLHDTHRLVDSKTSDDQMAAIERFTAANPGWFIAHHVPEQFGLTILYYAVGGMPLRKKIVRPWVYGRGPGATLMGYFEQMEIKPRQGCRCKSHVMQMNKWGVDGCRTNLKQILAWLKEDGIHFTWADRFKAAKIAVTPKLLGGAGLALKISPVNPLRSLVRLAIRDYELAEAEQSRT